MLGMTHPDGLYSLLAGLAILALVFLTIRLMTRHKMPPVTSLTRRCRLCGESFHITEGAESDTCPICLMGIGEWVL